MHRHLHKWHRRIGLAGALIAIYLAVTGLLLNHTHDLGLDRLHTRSALLLKIYNVKPMGGRIVNIPPHTIAQLGETLFIDGQAVGRDALPLAGAVRLENMFLLATRGRLHIFTMQGERVETLDRSSGLAERIRRIGLSAQKRVVVDDGTHFIQADSALIGWTAVDYTTNIAWSAVQALSPEQYRRLASLAPGSGPSWEHVLQDLHSGRLFGTVGVVVIDLAGFVILLLAVSGVVTITLRRKISRKRQR